jgi:hypothetical protein
MAWSPRCLAIMRSHRNKTTANAASPIIARYRRGRPLNHAQSMLAALTTNAPSQLRHRSAINSSNLSPEKCQSVWLMTSFLNARVSCATAQEKCSLANRMGEGQPATFNLWVVLVLSPERTARYTIYTSRAHRPRAANQPALRSPGNAGRRL